MIKIGSEPFLECSSKGDKRFSAFYARLKCANGRSIEEIYQGSKVFPDGSRGLSPLAAKGKKAVNMDFCKKVYEQAWQKYFEENPELLEYASNFNGFSDIFGQPNHQCQAIEIYKIVINYKKNKNKEIK